MIECLNEWEGLINDLADKERLLWDLKEEYADETERIIAETDFKEIYGRNNESVRKMHVKQELQEEYVKIQTLKMEIAYIERRISFLREKTKCERVLLEIKTE